MSSRVISLLLPTKGLSQDRALLTVGSLVLSALTTPTSVTGLWERFRRLQLAHGANPRISFDWFALALSLLFMLGLVERSTDGRLQKVDNVPSKPDIK
jgi:hypothetical protein